MKSRNVSYRKGFTLIELLVVIAIIAILAAILFPVFARARENARRASCQSNLKQISLGILQYNQDYDEKFPIVSGADLTLNWAVTVQPYLKSTQIMQCPSEPTAGDTNPYSNGYTDYWINERINGANGVSLASFTATAVTIMNGDGQSSAATPLHVNPHGNASYNMCDGDLQWEIGQPYTRRHLEGANYAFADGHVKWLRPERVEASKGDNASAGNPTFHLGDSGN